jgi:hypothetical protein
MLAGSLRPAKKYEVLFALFTLFKISSETQPAGDARRGVRSRRTKLSPGFRGQQSSITIQRAVVISAVVAYRLLDVEPDLGVESTMALGVAVMQLT